MSVETQDLISPSGRPLVLPFASLGAADLPLVGGKGANLGEMTGAGLPVPPGFCVTTEAFRRFVAGDPERETAVYARLAALAPDDVAGVREAGAAIRARLLALPVPAEVEAALLEAWRQLGEDGAYAVRSSATAEDLPGASFAGQQDTFLNVRGRDALVDALRRAWVSLFTDRAILYRAQNGFAHRDVSLSAVVQRMVMPEVSGILFTADPLSGNRHVASIDAGFGLGEALVSGIISADNFRVDKRSGEMLERRIADKQRAIRPLPGGGTETVELSPEDSERASLSDAQAIALAELGSRVEAHYGQPQDIEWVIDADAAIYVVQSRPITSLFPLPAPGPRDEALHAYASFNHFQVMTDAMSPMGRSVFQIILPFGRRDVTQENPFIPEAGGRLFIDITAPLHFEPTRRLLSAFFRIGDPLIGGAIGKLVEREDFQRGAQQMDERVSLTGLLRLILPNLLGVQRWLWLRSPERALPFVVETCDGLVDRARLRMARATPGAARLRVARESLGTTLRPMLATIPSVMGSGYAARAILGRLAGDRAGPGDLDAIARGLDGNVTTQMDLAVGDLADAARVLPELLERLGSGDSTRARELLETLPDGTAFDLAWRRFMERYGMRGPSEIDIGRPRWREDPSSLLQVIAGNLRGEAGAHRQHHRQMVVEGLAAGERLVEAAAHGPLAPLRRRLAERMLRVLRNGMPVREHPKFVLIRIMGLTKDAICEAADLLLQADRIEQRQDVFWLRLGELIDELERPSGDLRVRIARRKQAEAGFDKLRVPRVITSEGEIPEVSYEGGDAPEGALPGSSASPGVVEGMARVVLDPTTTVITPGEILVAPFTDPGWTPLFINAAALVMEVGGLMTHGSVVAREYGIPAVVGVLEATTRIQTGQRLRVDGNRGFVEILADEPASDVGNSGATRGDADVVGSPERRA